MFHFETSFCVMGDSWWPRNTGKKTRASLRMKPLAFFLGFSLDQLVGGFVANFWRFEQSIGQSHLQKLFQWDFT